MARRGRPRRLRRNVREFGKLMEAELAKVPKVEAAMAAIHRRNPRWGSRSKMFALWTAYKADKARKAQADQDQRRLTDAIHAGLQQMGPLDRAKAEAALSSGGGVPRWKLYASTLAILLRNRFFWNRS